MLLNLPRKCLDLDPQQKVVGEVRCAERQILMRQEEASLPPAASSESAITLFGDHTISMSDRASSTLIQEVINCSPIVCAGLIDVIRKMPGLLVSNCNFLSNCTYRLRAHSSIPRPSN